MCVSSLFTNCYYLVNVISFIPAQSNPIKRYLLYLVQPIVLFPDLRRCDTEVPNWNFPNHHSRRACVGKSCSQRCLGKSGTRRFSGPNRKPSFRPVWLLRTETGLECCTKIRFDVWLGKVVSISENQWLFWPDSGSGDLPAFRFPIHQRVRLGDPDRIFCRRCSEKNNKTEFKKYICIT